MTREEKREAIRAYCGHRDYCSTAGDFDVCPLHDLHKHGRSCYLRSGADVDGNYDALVRAGAIEPNDIEFVKVEREMTVRKSILDEAANIVCNDRNKQYGEPEDNFATIASLWNPYLSTRLGCDVKLDGADVGMLMTLFKCGRIVSGQAKRDNFVDAAGYIACAGEIALKGERNDEPKEN